jgi:hypothetical protein
LSKQPEKVKPKDPYEVMKELLKPKAEKKKE